MVDRWMCRFPNLIPQRRSFVLRWTLAVVFTVLAGACGPAANPEFTSTNVSDPAGASALLGTPSSSPVPPSSDSAVPATSTPTSTPTATPSPTPLPAVFVEPAGCERPPDAYERIRVNDWWLNARTMAMLEHAAAIYNGVIDVADSAITQGSYSDNGPASFGTHLGGGAVDISVIQPNGYSVLYEEIEPLIQALRAAGFAAWLRDWNELYLGSGIHIHAIAIGDEELSGAAREQLDGPFGYFRGYSGLPTKDGEPRPDRHGGPLICAWMTQMGYEDLRPQEAQAPDSRGDWVSRLAEVAEQYLTDDPADTLRIAHTLNYLGNGYEDSSNMCGPLAGAILRDAGLLPKTTSPLQDLKSFWLAKGIRENESPWRFFPKQDYQLSSYDTAVHQFDFGAWPLIPGDIVYTYAGSGEYEHIFVVTEVKQDGRAFTVTNQEQADGAYLISKVLLYDPQDWTVGAFRDAWIRDSWGVGRTGLGGFDVLRHRALSLPPGSLAPYTVMPGDTLQGLARRWNSTGEAVLEANELDPTQPLRVGQSVLVPVNIAEPVEIYSADTEAEGE
jgi:hypothetical protein